ncbi:MAG TPA: xanthine dehydrogenase family protein subunit M [Acidimicrobiales bacterium]|nr:xanthine dehydrogenase family protein subunit M [Acidimicrobiales bacterium]
MIPAKFDYREATSVEEAVALLAQHGEDAKLIAGGHSLLPLMKLRLASPAVLVDVGRLRDLAYVRDGGDHVAVGALTRHCDLERAGLAQAEAPLLAHVAAGVGDPQVRHRGTIGGSLAHGDPASDLPAACLALGATFVVRGPREERLVPADAFFQGFLQTALAPDEMLTEVRVPKQGGATWGWQKFTRRAQDWAIVGVAAVRNGTARVALVNMDDRPVRARGVEEALAAGASVEEAARRAADGLSPPTDLNGDAAYRSHVAGVLVRRALGGT